MVYFFERRKHGMILMGITAFMWFVMASGFLTMRTDFMDIPGYMILPISTLGLTAITVIWAISTAIFKPYSPSTAPEA